MNQVVQFRTAILMALFVLFSASLVAQQTRPLISVQGTLKDINGVTVADGTSSFTFKLYDVETGGSAVWEETAQVEVSGGIYSHNLGSVTDLDPDDFANTLYLGITVEGSELQPRTTLTYAPYAMSVSFAQSALRIAPTGCTGAVGDVKYSILNPTQFAAQNGDCWVPMDGRSMTGSELAGILGNSTVPDMSGLFMRAHEFSGSSQDGDPNRTSSTAVALVQDNSLKSHGHTMSADGGHDHSYGDSYLHRVYVGDQTTSFTIDDATGEFHLPRNGPMSWFGNNFNLWMEYENDGVDRMRLDNTVSVLRTGTEPNHTHTIYTTGGAETRPTNRSFYAYIRIN